MTTPSLLPKARLEALTDGIFAVTMTLLVLDLRLPEHAGGLAQTLAGLLPRVDDYAISFAVLCVFWIAHVALLARVRAADRALRLAQPRLPALHHVRAAAHRVRRSQRGRMPRRCSTGPTCSPSSPARRRCGAGRWRGSPTCRPTRPRRRGARRGGRFAVAGLTIAVAIALGLVEATLTESNAFSPYVYLLLLAAGLMRPAFDPPPSDGPAPD